MLKYRVITALILIPLVIAALFWLPLMGFALLTLVVCVLGAWEWGPLAGFRQRSQRGLLSGALALLLGGMTLWGEIPDPGLSHFWLWISLPWWVGALLLVLSYPVSATFWRNSSTLRLLFGLLTLVPFFWGMLALRAINIESEYYTGAWWLLYVMVLVWGADTGAYMFGKIFGRHKLAPRVSPGKTWEGLCGGLLTSALIAWLFGHYVNLNIEPVILLVCSVISVAASVLGDLTESMFKREAGIKDSGHLIPGHGGILDRIDSLTAAVPVFACLMLLWLGG